MALLYNLEPYLTDLSDTSSGETEPHETMASSAVPSSESLIMDRDKYSDKDIQILYQIVTRAEEILNDYTPTSRLPTHALYNAYDEVLPQYGINPDDDRLISELVFKVGGVRNTDSLREKFKTVMSRLGITVQWDDPPAHGNEHDDAHSNSGYTSDELSVGGSEDRHPVAAKIMPKEKPPLVNGRHTGNGYVVPEIRYDHHMDDVNGDASIRDDPGNLSKIEQQLECSAIAFQRKHHDKFSTMTAVRQWQKRSNFIGTLSDQFDAARQADLEEDLEAKFEEWRALSAEVDRLPPHRLPPNVYSKRFEEIAIRAREIHNAKITIRRWRHNAKEQSRKVRKIEESSDPIERVAAKAHKNLMLSRAFANWSNRLEEESDRAQMAAKVYEMRLKSKAFGIHRRPHEDVQMSGARDSPAESLPPAYIANSEDAPKLPPPDEKLESNVINHIIPPNPVPDVYEKTSPGAPAKNTCSNDDPDDSGNEEMDEITLLARRHILRMRYYDIWEKYTADKLNKAKGFQVETQNERIAQIIPVWRSQAEQASQQQDTLRYNAKRASYYNKAIKAIDVWRQESEEKTQGHDQVLDHYAKRANFYYKATKSVPIWRSETERAVKQQEVLELYADRAEYYGGVTKSLPIWRAQTQQVAEHEKQTLAHYAQRADYYYRTRDTLLSWQDLAKKKRKQRLKDAHLETRRLVKKGMGERCIAQWREKLQPSFERYEAMNVILEDVIADREYRQSMESFDTWRERARERNETGATSDVMAKEKLLRQWKDQSRRHEGLYIEAAQHWEETAKSKVLKKWNLTTIQMPNRPLMVENALEKKERRLLRTRFENWYGRTADKLVPIELPNGDYRSVDQVVEDAQRQASLNQARGLFDKWQAAAKTRSEAAQEEIYIPTPGRPRLFLGSLGTTTPLGPPPGRLNWRASEMIPRGSAIRGRTNRSGRPERNLRVSWA
ncbi:uncharacterized protein GGS22DRAFT_200312 [Annulohypoxylon maeteangense]|uniref:uncharacterized protein n=1 Tax=Annulohypoxylon maeteangense TaxID=1927788 RepID=UPI002008D2E4|nr:uncharacterized protein GGS22DRAFT_200312 [Annulohypoxylon maeteangense]KAI0884518.1 hypothetical protein GGS22DRAFT_200312 [Annulohypoxylon maeteangense]